MKASIWTKPELEALIVTFKAAYTAALQSKSYTIGNRTLTRQDLPEIKAELEYLQSELNRASGLPSGMVRVAPVFRR